MAQVEKYSKQAADGVVAPQSMSEDDPEYAVIVSSNQVRGSFCVVSCSADAVVFSRSL